jgi:DnaJ-class molecular chaperone
VTAAQTHANAQKQKSRKKGPPLLLSGISLDGPAHEILGVKVNATNSEVQKAWRDLMKRYHPDKVGRPGSREWSDAQRIAEAINQAKDEMTQRRRKA